jgi:hypothetical protein
MFPKKIYVRWDGEENGQTLLGAHTTEADALQEDGPEPIATYQRVEIRRLKKVVKAA